MKKNMDFQQTDEKQIVPISKTNNIPAYVNFANTYLFIHFDATDLLRATFHSAQNHG